MAALARVLVLAIVAAIAGAADDGSIVWPSLCQAQGFRPGLDCATCGIVDAALGDAGASAAAACRSCCLPDVRRRFAAATLRVCGKGSGGVGEFLEKNTADRFADRGLTVDDTACSMFLGGDAGATLVLQDRAGAPAARSQRKGRSSRAGAAAGDSGPEPVELAVTAWKVEHIAAFLDSVLPPAGADEE